MSHSILNDISRANPQLEYEVQQRIGGGTYGDVYKSRRIGTSTLAAIKIIKFEPGDDLSVILQEIVVMKELNHANVVAYYGAYMRQSRLWICMEYCSGGSLQDIYHAIGPLPERHVAYVLREMLKGLAYLHHMGKMHRDIKGANILLTEDGDVKLADFGVSAQITTTLSKRKSFIGSPYWMSPEIAAVERKGGYNQQCDIWSLGITAIELAELQPPLFDLHPMRALYLLSKSSYKSPVLKDKKKWSDDYQNFVKMALTKNPKKRPTAIQLEGHAFVRQANLGPALGRDLIDQSRNPRKGAAGSDRESLNDQDGDEGGFAHPPQLKRIPSKKPPDEANQPKNSPNLPSVLARFRNHLPGPSSPESVHLPTLDGSSDSGLHSSSTETLDRTLRRPAERPNNRPKSTPVLPSMTQQQPLVEDQLELDDDEFTATLRIGRQRYSEPLSSSDSRSVESNRTEWMEGEASSHSPHPEPPPRTKHLRKKQSQQDNNSNGGGTLVANGLPRTPLVHMGACFSKIFNECPLHINATASWIHPVTRDQHILVASEEGLYTLNLNELHELAMDLLHNRRTTWLHVSHDVLMTISGKTPHLYRHDLVALHARHTNRFSMSMSNRIPEKLMPKKFIASSKVAETKGCLRCCVAKNTINGARFLAAAMPTNIILMQWYEPMNKYMMLRQIDWRLPSPFNTFAMLIKDTDLPRVVTGVRPLVGDNESVQFELVDFTTSLVTVSNPRATSIPNAYLDVVSVTQVDNWTVVVVSDNVARVLDPEGSATAGATIAVTGFHFDFIISAVVCLPDSLLAFNRHGMQGRSFATDEVTQDIADATRVYRVLGTEKLTVLESKPADNVNVPGNLYIVTGHEASY